MKRFYPFVLVVSALVSCVAPEAGDGTEDYVSPFTLSVDKSVIEASGDDKAVFSLIDANGRNILEDRTAMQRVNIYDLDSDVRLSRLSSVYVSIDNNVHRFEASYAGQKSVNTVSLTVRNRAAYERYHRNVALFKCTSVNCSACPTLTFNLSEVDALTKKHMVILECHGDFGGATPFPVKVDNLSIGSYIMGVVGSSSWPTVVYDMDRSAIVQGASKVSDIEKYVWERRKLHPATCGISVSSSIDGNMLKVTAGIKSSTGGEYSLACAILQDGKVHEGKTYDDVVVNVTPNFMTYTSATMKTVGTDNEVTEEFSFEFQGGVPSDDELSSYEIAVYAHKRSAEGGSVIDNIVLAPFGEDIDYLMNE